VHPLIPFSSFIQGVSCLTMVLLRMFCDTRMPSVCFELQCGCGKPYCHKRLPVTREMLHNSCLWGRLVLRYARQLENTFETPSPVTQFLGTDPVRGSGDYGLSLADLIAPGSVIDVR
jgi:hypothetical protein